MLLVCGTAQSALVNGVRQKPVPETTSLAWNDTLYLFNVGVQKFFLGANDWSTRASVGDKGYKVIFQKHVEEGFDWDGTAAIWKDSVETKKSTLMVWIADTEGNCWVDWAGQADTTWLVRDMGQQTYRIAVGTYNPVYNQESYPDTWFGVQAGDESATPKCWAFLSETDNVDWKFVSIAAYEAHQAALAVYAKAEELRGLIEEAKALGVATTDAQGVYDNEGSTLEQIEEAIAALKAAITEAKENSASATNPADMTSLITNPNFDDNNGTGWSGTTPAFQSFGNAEHYNKTYDTWQEVSGLPNGVYAVTLDAYYRAGYSDNSFNLFQTGDLQQENAKLYAVAGTDTLQTALMNIFKGIEPNNSLGGNESIVSDGEYSYYVPNNMETAATYFNAGYYKGNRVFVATDDGKLKIGIYKKATIDGDWTLFDNFGLTYYGNKADAFKLWMDSILENYAITAEAEEALEDVVYTLSALDDYKAVVESVKGASTKEEILEAVKTLDAAKKAFQDNIDAWAAYLEALERGREVAGRPDSELAGVDKDNLADYVDWDAADILEARTLTTEEVLAEIEKLEELINLAIQNGLVPGQDFTKYLINPSFEDGQKGWTFNKISGSTLTTGGSASNKCAEAYQANFDVYQVVKNAPVGVYEVSVQAFYRAGVNADAWAAYQAAEGNIPCPISVYLNNNNTTIHNVFDVIIPTGEVFVEPWVGPAPYETEDIDGNAIWFANGMSTASDAFSAGYYSSSAFGLVAKKGDDMRLGIKGNITGSNQWAIWDNFKLTYQGFKVDVMRPELEKAINSANELLTSNMGTDVKSALEEAIAQAMQALGSDDGQAMFQALSNLFDQNEAVNNSIELFKELAGMVDQLQEVVMMSESEQALKDEANSLCEKALEEGTLTNEEATNMLARMKELMKLLRLPAGVASDSNPLDYTGLIETPDFDKDGVNSLEGWSNTDGYNFGNDDTQKSALAVEFYEKVFDMYQDIEMANVPNGTYKVQLSAFYRYGGIAEDYARWKEDPNCGIALIYAVSGGKTYTQPIALISSGGAEEGLGIGSETTITTDEGYSIYVPNDMVSASAYFTLEEPRYLNEFFIKVTDGKLRLGVKKETKETYDWMIMDSWRLIYYGENSEFDPEHSAISDVMAGEPVKVEFFNLNGVKLAQPQKGVMIMRATDANGKQTSKTILVK